MNIGARLIAIPRRSINLISHQFRALTTDSGLSERPNPITPVNPTHLLRVCTILYQQQDASDPKLHNALKRSEFQLTHEFFLQVCNKFPFSWRPIYRFYQFTQAQPHFNHTSLTFNKMVDCIGKSRNIDLFWELLQDMGRRRIVNDKTFRIALKTLASARELKKCIDFFHKMNDYGCCYSVETLNKVIETLCGSKLVDEAQHIVTKLKECVKPNGVTYKYLIFGLCEVGDLIEASKVWNLMADEGFEADVETVEKMMDTLFKTNQFDEALKLFQSMRTKRIDDLGLSTYRLVINWMCKKNKLAQAYLMFEEMQKRGIEADNLTLASLIYGLLTKARVREAYKIVEGIEKPDISVYHGLIKGLLKLRRASEATQVFREMIKRGCEPTMHTYIMLLQGHLGKRGRKGPDPLVNFDSIFVGGLVKAGKSLEATKYVERVMNRGLEVPRFDYNRFLHYYSNEEGVIMFEEVAKKLREVGLFDLADILARYGEKMATRDRRRNRALNLSHEDGHNSGPNI
ncbi:putative pentatricopeptide repeat-containing protein At1g26500 [Cornus florida]|uniref:putative pentatricopeptide repeat-containing protein At1g26500 n=1 Tax=Cornus florida TaxID=4283 RepID=UPI0028A14844|nr:putative pentatricopeptide repeat-containing protein At1g26500 [Cornus florida]XP_059648781.1 putative pentatricopeptide repeat-containing protein At1g26500 [Cornus florida]XP_059648782.1 putative pentatricopeptide repeat-containing protein At1g26500 [Cornus florida]XP_059648783.1 putative pentatricopeptide repeat-containing protein At1g26500 [Cornus florida]XP_059648784.1 putative pentatricopeptide repeat-containing protein At1g26500 [Cornus florida]XP_059648785.1 putative pentatricopeptid